MSSSSRPAGVQTYHVLLFDRALHPELFALRERRVIQGREYEAEAWVMDGAHIIRFEHRLACLSELVTDQETGVPRGGILGAFACAGEHEFEHRHDRSKCNFMVSVQTESLSDALYLAAREEYEDFGRDSGAIINQWTDESGECLSVLDIQQHHRQVHVQAYHLIATGGYFLRTQSIFELI